MWSTSGRISGYGGGVLAANNSVVNFSGSSFGIYGNRADMGGDDIATSAVNETV